MDIYGIQLVYCVPLIRKHVNQEDQAISLVLVIVWLLEGDLAHIGISLSICSKNAIETTFLSSVPLLQQRKWPASFSKGGLATCPCSFHTQIPIGLSWFYLLQNPTSSSSEILVVPHLNFVSVLFISPLFSATTCPKPPSLFPGLL